MITIPACAVCVAPAEGRPRYLVQPGATVERGQIVAVVDGGAGSTPIHAPVGGRVGGPLAAPEQPVVPGEGVLWLSR